MKSLKHLPTKPTWVKSVKRKPHLRLQHYNPDKDKKFKLDNYISDKNYLNLLNKTIFHENITSVKDFEKHLTDLFNDPERSLYTLYNRSLQHYLPFIFNLKHQGINLKIFDEFLTFIKEEFSSRFDAFFDRNDHLFYMQNFIRLNEKDHEKIFEDFLKYFGLYDTYIEKFADNSIYKDILLSYVKHSPTSIEPITFMFQRLIRNKMKPTNKLEYVIKGIYENFQEIIRKRGIPKRFYRGMRFEITKNRPYVKIKGSRLSGSSLDKSIANEFTIYTDEDTKYYKSRNDLKKDLGIEIDLPETYKKYLDIFEEEIMVNEIADIIEGRATMGYEVGYMLTFKPKYASQIFAVLHGDYLKDFMNKIGFSEIIPEIDFLGAEKEWIIFM